MIPGTISWHYKHADISNGATFNVCCRVSRAVNDIDLFNFVSEDLTGYMMFVCIIRNNEEKERNTVYCLLADEESIDQHFIPAGSYYITYLVPHKNQVDSSNLKITDLLNRDKHIELQYNQIFNTSYYTKAHLPPNTFIFN